jgi:hypothetical protein
MQWLDADYLQKQDATLHYSTGKGNNLNGTMKRMRGKRYR